ncbi:MAG: heme o synthase [Aigarchaeota archaeon]|nr:heme o synthase [Aigarchaeota archaeon]MDW8092293.1 heme o synthase [Nitrososphaerota archaeon]
MSTRLRDLISITKPKIALLNLMTCLTCYFAGSGPIVGALPLFISGYLAAGGSAVLNNYLDKELDSKMRRTVKRPIPSGRLNPFLTLVMGLLMLIASLVISAYTLNPLTSLLMLSGALFYVIVYTLVLKRRTYWNIVIGGAAGSFPPLAGWAAATGTVAAVPALLAVLIFLWTPGHFWALSIRAVDDYRAAGIPMLPAVVGVERASEVTGASNLSMLPLWGLCTFLVPNPVLYLLVSAPLTFVLSFYSLRLMSSHDPGIAWKLFKYSSPWLMSVCIAVLVSYLIVP